MATTLEMEAVKSGRGRARRVVYYRFRFSGERAWRAAVGPDADGGWHALLYGRRVPHDNVELGHFATRAQANARVRAALKALGGWSG